MNKENKKPIRVGNGKKRKENWLTATICLDKLQEHLYDYNGKQYVNLNINIREQPDQYGKDVELSINEYKPNKIQVNQAPKGVSMTSYNDDVPF
jgi:hypothetical protein